MGRLIKLAVLTIALAGWNVQSAHHDHELCHFVPENDRYIAAGSKFANSMTEERFDEILDQVEQVYSPIISDLGAKLVVDRNWEDGTVNAYAQRKGNTYMIAMFGGLARHDQITDDGFFLVACHELGHHLGGAPKVRSINSWASNEGQSDYFATLKCLRKVWSTDDNETIVAQMDVDPTALQNCEANFTERTEVLICIRGAMAGLSVGYVFQDLRNETVRARIDTPDENVATRTDDRHPGSQCRIDTYYQGAICNAPLAEDVSNSDYTTGTCARKLGATTGLRPLCWFKPN
jgi:hypothetical protein